MVKVTNNDISPSHQASYFHFQTGTSLFLTELTCPTAFCKFRVPDTESSRTTRILLVAEGGGTAAGASSVPQDYFCLYLFLFSLLANRDNSQVAHPEAPSRGDKTPQITNTGQE